MNPGKGNEMGSTTSRRLARVWSLVQGAQETGYHHLAVEDVEAALEGNQRWFDTLALSSNDPEAEDALIEAAYAPYPNGEMVTLP